MSISPIAQYKKPRRSPQHLRFLYCILEEISCTICISCFLLFLNLGRQKKNTSDKGVFSKKARDFVQIQINTKILFQNCAKSASVLDNTLRRTTPCLSVMKFCRFSVKCCILSSLSSSLSTVTRYSFAFGFLFRFYRVRALCLIKIIYQQCP